MSRYFPIVFMLFSTVLYPQVELYGKYCSIAIGEADVTCLDFLEDNRFKYVVTGCLGVSRIGEGRYELNKATLKLLFDKIERPPLSKVEIAEKPSISNQEVTFEFNIQDQYGQPIFVFATEKGSNKDVGIDYEENKLVLRKSNEKITYEIHAVNYETVEVELSKDSDKIIEITLYERPPMIISEQTFRWKLTSIEANEFKIGMEYWNTFKKVIE